MFQWLRNWWNGVKSWWSGSSSNQDNVSSPVNMGGGAQAPVGRVFLAMI
ncbi:MAG: hypothetical protein KA998_02600 [Rickettsiaceae bacterium]|nr:hypothetical protein [Rickettsiaceae bacterium]